MADKTYPMRLRLSEDDVKIVKNELSKYTGEDMSTLLSEDEYGEQGIDWNLRDKSDIDMIENINDFITMTKVLAAALNPTKKQLTRLGEAGMRGAEAGRALRDKLIDIKEKTTKHRQTCTRIRRVKA